MEQRYRYAVACAALLSFALSVLSAILLPYFDGPDEPRHVNSVARLVDGGGWPAPYEAKMLGSTLQAMYEAGDLLPDLTSAEEPAQPDDRSDLLGATDRPDEFRDFMVQHPPGFYAVEAAVVAAFGGGELRWDHAVLIMRVVSALITAAAMPFVIGFARWSTGSRSAGLVGGLLVLAIPFYPVMGGYVSNDALLITTCSAALYFSARAMRDPVARWFWMPLAGVAVAGALFTKGLALLILPTVGVFALVATHRRGWSVGSVATQVVLPLAVAMAGGWWWIHNLVTLGVVQPSQHGARPRAAEPAEGYDLGLFLGNFFARLNATFWNRGANEAKALPDTLEATLGIVFLVLLVAAFVWGRSRGILAVAMLFPLLITVTLVQNAHTIYWNLGDPDRGIQGRYLFGAVAVFALAFAMVWLALRRGLPRMARAVAVLAALAPAAVAGWFLGWLVPRTWDAAGMSWSGSLPDDIMGVPVAIYPVAAGVAAAATVSLALLVGRGPHPSATASPTTPQENR